MVNKKLAELDVDNYGHLFRNELFKLQQKGLKGIVDFKIRIVEGRTSKIRSTEHNVVLYIGSDLLTIEDGSNQLPYIIGRLIGEDYYNRNLKGVDMSFSIVTIPTCTSFGKNFSYMLCKNFREKVEGLDRFLKTIEGGSVTIEDCRVVLRSMESLSDVKCVDKYLILQDLSDKIVNVFMKRGYNIGTRIKVVEDKLKDKVITVGTHDYEVAVKIDSKFIDRYVGANGEVKSETKAEILTEIIKACGLSYYDYNIKDKKGGIVRLGYTTREYTIGQREIFAMYFTYIMCGYIDFGITDIDAYLKRVLLPIMRKDDYLITKKLLQR